MANELLYTFDGNESAPVKFYYFDLDYAAKGDGIRFALYHSQIPFIDVRLTGASFRELKESNELPFGQVPALRTSDGKTLLVQSAAIMRLVGKLPTSADLRLYPDDPVEACKIDGVVDQEVDLFMGLTVSKYHKRFGFGHLTEEPDTVKKIRKSLSDEVLPRHLTNIERTIDSNVGPWLAGQPRPTIADFALAPRLKDLSSGIIEGIPPEILDGHPKLLALIDAFYDLDSVKKFQEKRSAKRRKT